MFYDLESPIDFARDIESILADDGIWHFEQSYMPTMLKNISYDTICHEHLEFYSLSVIKRILETVGLKLIDVELNDINGGSFAVTACKNQSSYQVNNARVDKLLNEEKLMGIDTLDAYVKFAEQSAKHRQDIRNLFDELLKNGAKIFGYGASTKGNVILQYCGIGEKEIPYIVEVNPDKFGAFTPGTNIPIISEAEGIKMNPDYYFVLPWHFRENILPREKDFLKSGGKFIFPLPKLEIVGIDDVNF